VLNWEERDDDVGGGNANESSGRLEKKTEGQIGKPGRENPECEWWSLDKIMCLPWILS
jgi:hypothetical protein